MHLVLRAFLISSTMLHVIAQRQGDMPSWWNLSPAIIARTHYPVASLMVFVIMCFDCIETETQLFRICFEWLTDGFLILKSFILSLHKWVLFFSWSLAGRQHKSLGTVRTHTHTHTHAHTGMMTWENGRKCSRVNFCLVWSHLSSDIESLGDHRRDCDVSLARRGNTPQRGRACWCNLLQHYTPPKKVFKILFRFKLTFKTFTRCFPYLIWRKKCTASARLCLSFYSQRVKVWLRIRFTSPSGLPERFL